MSYVGKILIVIQLALSLLFMVFAGSVAAVHENWQSKHAAVQSELQRVQGERKAAQDELELKTRDFDTQLQAQKQIAADNEAENVGLKAQVVTLQERQNILETQIQTQTGLAEAKANEARFRQQEAELQRIENKKLQARVDELAADKRDLSDQVFTKDQQIAAINRKFETDLGQLAYLKRVVAANDLETDPDVVEAMQSPPPPVEGIVTLTKKNRAGRVDLAEISIGADDGLVKGHLLDVIRIAGSVRPDWLGTVEVVEVYPDSAVVKVVNPDKNGIIQEGDNVTSKLR